MPLSNPFRRDAASPTLRQRAADLRAKTARVVRRAKPLPEPGSPEAASAFKAACREDTRLSVGIVDGYPELHRPPHGWWTTDCLGRALETGMLTPPEVARLYPLASERELRLRAISHRLNLGALHALAFAADYPHPPADTVDPIHAAITAHIAARETLDAAVDADNATWEDRRGGTATAEAATRARTAWEAANRAEIEAWADVFDVRPTTLPGVLALARHAARWAPNNDGMAAGLRLEDVFGAIADGLGGVMPDASSTVPDANPARQDDRAWANAQADAFDFSSLSLMQLCNLFDCYVETADRWLGLGQVPAMGACHPNGLREPNAAGRVVDREQERVAEIRDRIAAEIERRTPAGDTERDFQLGTAIRHELMCNGDLRDPAIRARIAQTWGA